ncbi:unnamed protein product [Moneuplotes crassus]|uniref:Uncharacterized protein n=1 Tax=Euplotes crassus TaxID=5936 RepID=A0AAD1UBF5_EUPCR|nr:unnamed protein product [Moneuplotes crassus]
MKDIEESKEYAIQAQLEKLDANTLEIVNKQYFNRRIYGRDMKSIRVNFDIPHKRVLFKKMMKQGTQANHISLLSFQKVARREEMITEFLSGVRVEKINQLCLKGSTDLVDFSFYTRSLMKFISKTVVLVRITFFKISHRGFGRILMACNNKSKIKFMKCRITVDHLDYLDNAQPLIIQLDLFRNKIIQPEEDTADLNGLIQKMADSKLNTCLKTVIIKLPIQYRCAKDTDMNRNYNIGKFTVNISI